MLIYLLYYQKDVVYLRKMVPVDDITKSEAIALKDQIATTKKSEEDKVKKYVK